MAANERIVVSGLKPETITVIRALELSVQKIADNDSSPDMMIYIRRLAGKWDGQTYQNPEGYGGTSTANRQMDLIVGALRKNPKTWKPLKEAIDSTGIPQDQLTAAADDIKTKFTELGLKGTGKGRW